MDPKETRDEGELVAELIESGSELAGGAASAALSLVLGPVGGVATGVVISRTLKHVGAELQRRLLAPRQTVRVGAAFKFAAEEIAVRLEGGDTPRADGWFDTDETGRPAADELLEGVLLNAADSYEERKVKHLGWLFASLAFDSRFDRGYANLLLTLSQRLTHRQLVCLALLGSDAGALKSAIGALERARWGEGASGAPPSDPIVADLSELGQSGLIGGLRTAGQEFAEPSPVLMGESIVNTRPTSLRPTSVGAHLAKLMKLDQIPQADIEDVYRELGGDPSQIDWSLMPK